MSSTPRAAVRPKVCRSSSSGRTRTAAAGRSSDAAPPTPTVASTRSPPTGGASPAGPTASPSTPAPTSRGPVCGPSSPRSPSSSRSTRARSTSTCRCSSPRTATAHTEGAETTMSTVLGRNNYGKSGVRLVKVTRRPDRHDICDLTVDVALEGDFAAAHTAGDNTGLLATDTMRNTVYALAQGHDDVDDVERFGIRLVEHFLAAGPTVTRARVRLAGHPWSRLTAGAAPDPHAFQRGNGGDPAGISVEAGIDGLVGLKTTGSGWEGYHRDEYTSLAETDDRIMATEVTARWTYGTPLSEIDFTASWEAVRAVILATFGDHYSPSVQFTLHRMGDAVLEARPEV